MASVEIQTPDGVLRVRLDRDHFTIGRLATNDIALPYSHISRNHAELWLRGQSWWLVDKRSTNGLHVGGQRVGEVQLMPGAAVMLSPLISLSLLEVTTPPAYAYAPAHAYPQVELPPASVPAPYPSSPAPSASLEPITPLSELGPRSPYADDEAPFYPHMRPQEPARAAQPNVTPNHPAAFVARQPSPPSAPIQPFAPANGNSGMFDPQRQAAQAYEQRRTANAAPSPLLHVCQTCGQRTMPDAVYCQNCHHSIATECARCQLSLLPVQDLCPRCQTPNPFSVRRFRRAGGPT